MQTKTACVSIHIRSKDYVGMVLDLSSPFLGSASFWVTFLLVMFHVYYVILLLEDL